MKFTCYTNSDCPLYVFHWDESTGGIKVFEAERGRDIFERMNPNDPDMRPFLDWFARCLQNEEIFTKHEIETEDTQP